MMQMQNSFRRLFFLSIALIMFSFSFAYHSPAEAGYRGYWGLLASNLGKKVSTNLGAIQALPTCSAIVCFLVTPSLSNTRLAKATP